MTRIPMTHNGSSGACRRVLPGAGHHRRDGSAVGQDDEVTTYPMIDDLVRTFKAEGRIVIVGASLAGLRAAEALRDVGFWAR